MEPKLDLSNVTLEKLVAAAETALAKETARKPLGEVIAPPRITIREKIDLIAKTMREVERSTFHTLLTQGASRLEIVVTFLAMLELIKRYRIQATQDGLFNDIEISRMDEWEDEEELELEFE